MSAPFKANTYASININKSDRVNEDNEFLLEDINNTCKTLILLYIYFLPKFPNHGFKVGMTQCKPGETFWSAIKSRINNQEHELALSEDHYQKYGKDREVVYWGVCLDANNESFKDYHVHNSIIREYAGLTEKDQEWFNGLPLEEIIDIFDKCRREGSQKEIYTPRKEQRECIDALTAYFNKYPVGQRFLLNCKMRFGKCFTTYKFCEENNINKILILTFVPAVQQSWAEDLLHIKKKYEYFTDDDLRRSAINSARSKFSNMSLFDETETNYDNFFLSEVKEPFVVFLSLQNYLGKDSTTNKTKEKIKQLQGIDFDLVVFDEYHFGAWNDRTQETILEDFEPDYAKAIKKGAGNQDILKKFQINTKKTICLSGTPFKAIARGEFNQENSFTYSYFDEQKNKYPNHDNDDFSVVNPDYAHFPDMRIFGYNMSRLFKGLEEDVLSNDKLLGKKYFSLNLFFDTTKANNPDLPNVFIYENEIKDWLEIIKGNSPKNGQDFPYSNPHMLKNNKHTLWLMPTMNSCKAMEDLLLKDDYFSCYQIINLSQSEVGSGQKALDYLKIKIKEGENTGKLGSIAITVNKLTTGVTVKPWMSVFVLKDLASPESYFQSIFRIQTPYVVDGKILKKEGYVFDFNIDRAASLMLKFAEQSADRQTTKLQIAKLIVKFMPIYMNGRMDEPISYDVFYTLAQYGDSNGIPLSKRIRDINTTTRMLDEDVVSNMLNDPKVSDVIKRVFAHTKFTKNKTNTKPNKPDDGFDSEARLKGQKDGHSHGLVDFEKYLDWDDEDIQHEFDSTVNNYVTELCPSEYTDSQKKYYYNGFIKGYESGVNAPIKKLQCGKDDGAAYAKDMQNKHSAGFYYEGNNKAIIDNETKKYLNDDTNIPEEYKKFLYKRWYKESFLKTVRNVLKRYEKPEEGQSIEDANNVIQHLISRLFQFLYISVYRETTFNEIFNNANPEVFLEAVGITKEDFETLNQYNVFQEDVLNNYIHEFFVNESLGHKLNQDDEFVKENYRSSFEWFGFSDINSNDVETIDNYVPVDTPLVEILEPRIETQDETEVIKKVTDIDVSQEQVDDLTTNQIKEEELNVVENYESIPKCSTSLNEMEEKVYTAVYIISMLETKIHCHPNIKTIKNYLTGNSSSVFYSDFNGKKYCGSCGFFLSFKIEKAVKTLIEKKVLKVVHGKKEMYYISEKIV